MRLILQKIFCRQFAKAEQKRAFHTHYSSFEVFFWKKLSQTHEGVPVSRHTCMYLKAVDDIQGLTHLNIHIGESKLSSKISLDRCCDAVNALC